MRDAVIRNKPVKVRRYVDDGQPTGGPARKPHRKGQAGQPKSYAPKPYGKKPYGKKPY
jgi:hypothetical protein